MNPAEHASDRLKRMVHITLRYVWQRLARFFVELQGEIVVRKPAVSQLLHRFTPLDWIINKRHQFSRQVQQLMDAREMGFCV